MNCYGTGYNCPVDATLEMIGGKYKALILWHLLDKTLRFGELHKLIPQAKSKMLTQQLRELEVHQLVNRTIYPVVPPKVEYTLTPLGKSIRPILLVMYDWGAEYLTLQGKEVLLLHDHPTGASTHGQLSTQKASSPGFAYA